MWPFNDTGVKVPPSHFSKLCLEVTSPGHGDVLQVSLFANVSTSVEQGVKRHPNTNVKDTSQDMSWLWQKWRKIVVILNKTSGISRPRFLSNSTCRFIGSCVKHRRGRLQDLLLKYLSEHSCSSVTRSRSVDVLQDYLSTSGESPVDVLDFHPQDKALVRSWTSFLQRSPGPSFRDVLGKGTPRICYAVGKKKGLSLSFVIIGSFYKTKRTHVCNLWTSVNNSTSFHLLCCSVNMPSSCVHFLYKVTIITVVIIFLWKTPGALFFLN